MQFSRLIFRRTKIRLYFLTLLTFTLAGILVTPFPTAATCDPHEGCTFVHYFPCTLPGFCPACPTDACVWECNGQEFEYPGTCCTCV